MKISHVENCGTHKRYHTQDKQGEFAFVDLDSRLNYIDGTYPSSSMNTAIQVEAVVRHLMAKN